MEVVSSMLNTPCLSCNIWSQNCKARATKGEGTQLLRVQD